MGGNRLQTNIATGSLTLPVVVLVCAILWLVQIHSWVELVSLAIVAVTGFVMIGANVNFSLIRQRTTLPVCFYWIFMASMGFLHPFQLTLLVPLSWILAVFALFFSYESPRPVYPIFHAFLFLGTGSLIFPPLLHYTPLFLLYTLIFQAFTVKSFFAALFGLLIPYWFLFGYAFFYGDMPLFYAPFRELFHFQDLSYSVIILEVWVSWGVVTLLQLVASLHYFNVSYQDKTRTRYFIFFLLFLGLYTLAYTLFQPHHLQCLLPIQLICTAFLSAHLFTLTRNRFSSIAFIVTIVVIVMLIGYNLWM